jgi:hypothetical protein
LVEVLEYALVVVASSLLAFFSVGVYSGLASALGPASDEAAFASVVSLASAAVEHGSASATLTFSDAVIGCSAGVLTLSSGKYSQNSTLPTECSIPQIGLSGQRQLTFSFSGTLLTLQVK